jgi:hypothetical protein
MRDNPSLHKPVLLFVVLIGMTGCRKATPTSVEEAGASQSRREALASLEGSPRCTTTEMNHFGDDEEGEDLEVGDGLFALGDVFVGVSRTVHGSRLASIARVRRGEAKPRFADLGRVSSNASPCTLFARDREVFAVGRVSPTVAGGAGETAIRADGGSATLFRIAQGSPVSPQTGASFGSSPQAGTPEPLVTVAPTGPDSSAVAAVAAPLGSPLGAVLAWDEDAISPVSASSEHSGTGIDVRGVVRVALIGPDMRSLLRVDTASPD